jgi:hypothetical protein
MIESLVAQVTSPETPWEERIASEHRLLAEDPLEVLPLLLPAVGQGMPEGGIFNSGGSDAELESAPARWQAYYVTKRLWRHLLSLAQDAQKRCIRWLQKGLRSTED